MTTYLALDSGGSPRAETISGGSNWSRVNPESTEVSRTKERNTKLGDSVGWARLIILALGTTCILAATGILAFLWRGAITAKNQGDPGSLWLSLVSKGWATITVTICAAAIRTAISLQAGLVMSMLAALLLEKHSAQFKDIPFLSMVRAVSVQPISMLVTGGRGVLKTSGYIYFLPLVIASSIAIATTFTSTILLSDFETITIVGRPNTTLIGYANQSTAIDFDSWRSAPGQYPRFAEYTNSTRAVGEHIDDTGLTLRVPLPLQNSSSRESLRSYKGPATVFDTRVICAAPNLTITGINLTMPIGDQGFSSGAYKLALWGSATFDKQQPAPLQEEVPLDTELPFSCLSPDFLIAPHMRWNLSVCTVRRILVDDHVLFGIKPFLPVLDDSEVLDQYVFFIFNGTVQNVHNSWGDFVAPPYVDNFNISLPEEAVVTTLYGPWAHILGVKQFDGLELSVTSCVTSTRGVPFNVSITSEADGSEPSMSWAGEFLSGNEENTPQHAYDTTTVRQQLAVTESTSLTRHERGVMDLDFTATDWSQPIKHADGYGFSTGYLFPKFMFFQKDQAFTDPTAVMSYGKGQDFGHPAHVPLFHDALVATASPARALQSWLTTLIDQHFYDSLGRFTVGAEVELTRSESVFAPARWTGFYGIMAVLAVHLLVVVAVTVWYVSETRYSMLGNSWMAVAQVVSDTTMPVLWRAGDLKDSEVEAIRQEEMGPVPRRFRVMRRRKTDRREVVAL